MDVREKLVELIAQKVCDTWSESCDQWLPHDCGKCYANDCHISELADHLISNGVTVQEWINSEEMLPEFPCLALYVNGNSVFIPDGVLTIKDKHGEWCIDSSLAKEVRLIDGSKIDALIWENRIAYWMPLPQKPEEGE